MDVKLGVDTLCYHCRLEAGEISLEEVLTEARELGADFVQINTYHVRKRELSYLASLRATAADLGLSLCCAGDFLGAARRGDQVSEGVRRVLDWAGQAEAMGSPYVRVASGFYRHELMDKPEVIRQEQAFVTEVLQKSVSELGGAPVRPVLENHSDFTADEYVQIVRAVGPDAMGVFLDVINPITMLADPSAVVARLLPWASAGHVKDYRFQSVFVEDFFHRRGWNVEYVYPGEGVADLRSLIGQIAADTRQGPYWLSVEGLSNYPGLADQKYRLQASFQLLRGILADA
jgi:sugar phosphate isomerase/epimerase